jgi:hypothetical protein
MLKNSDKLTDKQRAKFIEINQASLLTAREWKMKEKKRKSQSLNYF